MNVAALLVIVAIASEECAWAELGETRQEIKARYQHHDKCTRTDNCVRSAEKPLEFRGKCRVVLVWLQDGHSVAEMFLCPHGLRQEQIETLLAREAGSSTWAKMPFNQDHTQLWTRKDYRATAWVTAPDSQFAVFVSVNTDQLPRLARDSSFQAVAARTPALWAKLLEIAHEASAHIAGQPGTEVQKNNLAQSVP